MITLGGRRGRKEEEEREGGGEKERGRGREGEKEGKEEREEERDLYQGQILCWQSEQVISKLRIKAGKIFKVNLHPILMEVVVPFQLVPMENGWVSVY